MMVFFSSGGELSGGELSRPFRRFLGIHGWLLGSPVVASIPSGSVGNVPLRRIPLCVTDLAIKPGLPGLFLEGARTKKLSHSADFPAPAKSLSGADNR